VAQAGGVRRVARDIARALSVTIQSRFGQRCSMQRQLATRYLVLIGAKPSVAPMVLFQGVLQRRPLETNMSDDLNSQGRKANQAEAPGQFTADGGARAVEKTGRKAQEAAGPDGPDAAEVGDTFKPSPSASISASGH
jgi:hypothetical protein